jgi:hypothetical protein
MRFTEQVQPRHAPRAGKLPPLRLAHDIEPHRVDDPFAAAANRLKIGQHAGRAAAGVQNPFEAGIGDGHGAVDSAWSTGRALRLAVQPVVFTTRSRTPEITKIGAARFVR